jgi:nitrogen fixation protein NifX
MAATRIAAVSTDGLNVDDHFGKAQRFLIYDLDDQLTFVEERSTEMLSVDDPGHTFDADKFNRILSILKDCRKVYVTRIGDIPAAKLKEAGIEPVVYSGAIAAVTA